MRFLCVHNFLFNIQRFVEIFFFKCHVSSELSRYKNIVCGMWAKNASTLVFPSNVILCIGHYFLPFMFCLFFCVFNHSFLLFLSISFALFLSLSLCFTITQEDIQYHTHIGRVIKRIGSQPKYCIQSVMLCFCTTKARQTAFSAAQHALHVLDVMQGGFHLLLEQFVFLSLCHEVVCKDHWLKAHTLHTF